MSILNEAANTTMPLSSQVIKLDISTTGVLYVIPAGFAGKMCTWTIWPDSPGGTEVFAEVLFGTSTVSVTYGQESSVDGSGNITVHAASGMRLSSARPTSGIMRSIVSGVSTHFYVDAVGDGKLEIAITAE